MSLLWRKKRGEPCSECDDESTIIDLTCDFCDKVCMIYVIIVTSTVWSLLPLSLGISWTLPKEYFCLHFLK